jgi:hypothetical protein
MLQLDINEQLARRHDRRAVPQNRAIGKSPTAALRDRNLSKPAFASRPKGSIDSEAMSSYHLVLAKEQSMPTQFPLGTIIAERRVALYDQAGEERWISVRLGSPIAVRLEDGTPLGPKDADEGTFRCPVQILGLDHDETVYASFGEDPFVALHYALDLIGDLLKKGSDRLNLENRHPVPPPTRDHWIWRYSD